MAVTVTITKRNSIMHSGVHKAKTLNMEYSHTVNLHMPQEETFSYLEPYVHLINIGNLAQKTALEFDVEALGHTHKSTYAIYTK